MTQEPQQLQGTRILSDVSTDSESLVRAMALPANLE